VLLHLIDMAPVDPNADPVRDARAIVAELKAYSKDLGTKPRWLVINKRDLLPDDEAEKLSKDIARRLRFTGPVHLISGATGRGTRELAESIMRFLETQGSATPSGEEPAAEPKRVVKAAAKPKTPKRRSRHV
jgi:GTP-binding protein